MDHLVILRRSWHLLPRILAGEKRVESRWYKTKRAPWGAVSAGDTLYFKNSGEPVTAKARVAKVMQFADLDPARIKAILTEHGPDLGLESRELPGYIERFQNKRYCILVCLSDAERIAPFQVDKRGYGAREAWLTLDKIQEIMAD